MHAASRQVFNNNVFNTAALLAYSSNSVDACKKDDDAVKFTAISIGLFTCGLAATKVPEDRHIVMGSVTLHVDLCGQITGFEECLRQLELHKSVSLMLLATWQELVINGTLSSAISRDSVSASDVLKFILILRRHAWKFPDLKQT